MLASPLPPSLLETYSLSTSSLGCKALCIVISFLVLWSICLSSSLVHLRKCLEYLRSNTAQVFVPLIRFLLLSFVLSSFLVLLRYSFWIIIPWEFFISVLSDDPSLRSKRPKTSSSPQESSQYSGRFKNGVVWMVSTRALISDSTSSFANPLVIVLRAPITIFISVPFMFHSFFQFPFKVHCTYPSFSFLSTLLLILRNLEYDFTYIVVIQTTSFLLRDFPR